MSKIIVRYESSSQRLAVRRVGVLEGSTIAYFVNQLTTINIMNGSLVYLGDQASG